MRKTMLAFLLVPFLSYAQDAELPKIENDTLFTTSGFKVTKDQEIKVGMGSTPDGDFKFIRRNSASLLSYTSNTANQANDANALNRSFSGYKYKVLRVEKRGTKKAGYKYYLVLNTGMVRYEVDVENAIASGEIVVPDEFKPKSQSASVVQVKQELSVADELKKLKGLFDEGVLTKEEYEAQKKKLLEK